MRALQEALERHRIPCERSPRGSPKRPSTPSSLRLFQQLVDLGYLSMVPADKGGTVLQGPVESELIENFEDFKQISKFTRRVLVNHLVKTTSLLNLVHTR